MVIDVGLNREDRSSIPYNYNGKGLEPHDVRTDLPIGLCGQTGRILLMGKKRFNTTTT
jgi:hypothetical protein